MTCSNRCANPVRPTTSFFEPTLYQTLTATVGVVLSGERITVKPFGSVNVSNGSRRVSDAAPARTDCRAEDDACVATPTVSTAKLAIAARSIDRTGNLLP